MSGKKKEMKIEFRLLCDIMAKTISVKAGSFDAITQEKFLMIAGITCGVQVNWNKILFNILKDMVTAETRQARGYAIQISLLLENFPNLELGESTEFPSSKILIENTVHRYIILNEKVGGEDVTDAPRNNRTTQSKPVSSKDILVTRPVEAVPLQMIAPTTAALTEQLPVPKRPTQKRKRRLILGSDDEIVDSEPVFAGVEGKQAETAAGSVTVEKIVESVAEPVSELAVADVVNERPSTTDDVDDIIQQTEASPDEHLVKEPMEAIEEKLVSVDEAMSLEDILMSIPVYVPLPSAGVEVMKISLGKSIKIPGVDERTWYMASLPQIPVDDKGKEPLLEKDPVKGNPMKEQFLLIVADIDLLVQLREHIIDEATKKAISHQILDFRAQAQENYNILTAQLSELVAYINRGGNDKKGKIAAAKVLSRLRMIKAGLVKAVPAEVVDLVVMEGEEVIVIDPQNVDAVENRHHVI
ncbi:UDP-glucuronic acid decarboxylase 1 [Dorcoceras hygrometricum]|uniref:UDP-glucuronic acid decarboxylase 1 n=1 Tax=Dorcoceras hygrometricum TaxID=472368 RepID=A0A2Z7BK78_9LAMI|nr:UDP-glucuronic acid decarboxylase 1 [Dorcoceras hygrometricum]